MELVNYLCETRGPVFHAGGHRAILSVFRTGLIPSLLED